MTNQELLGLLVTELLSQSSQKMTEFSRADETVPILVKVPQSLDEVITGVSGSPGTNGLDIQLFIMMTH